MSVAITLLLLSVPGLPLLLALALSRAKNRASAVWRSAGLWPKLLALLPAAALLLIPGDVAIDLPWVLLGSGLGIDGMARWMLAMAVLLWAGAAILRRQPTGSRPGRGRDSLFLITMAGQLGAILSTDLAGFLAASALMGYGFYALMVANETQAGAARRAGRLYLGLMILADLLLFDALLMVARMGTGLSFVDLADLSTAMPSPGLYVSLVVIAFGLKAGVWPLHFWLAPAYASLRPGVAVMLGGVPVATALFGMLRWLPLGRVDLPGYGPMILGAGIAAILYAVATSIKQRRPAAATAIIILTGLFTSAVGTGLANPGAWARYPLAASLLIVALGLGTGLLSLVADRRVMSIDRLWFERWSTIAGAWLRSFTADWRRRLTMAAQANADRLRLADDWRRLLESGEHRLQSWPLAITLFLLLAILIAIITTQD
jgi:formate hydrogenlyase subunit 3/multisubunit Na+/H+ antiporter MnhD subunit